MCEQKINLHLQSEDDLFLYRRFIPFPRHVIFNILSVTRKVMDERHVDVFLKPDSRGTKWCSCQNTKFSLAQPKRFIH